MPAQLLRHPSPAELPALIELIVTCQQDPQRSCLHLDHQSASIQADLQALSHPPEQAFRILYDARGQIQGALGLDLSQQRGWLHGPFAQGDCEAVYARLWQDLWQRLPAGIQQLSNFIDMAAQDLRDSHLAQGFVSSTPSYIFQMPAQLQSAEAGLPEASATEAEALANLHSTAFPQTWLSPAELIRAQAPQEALLCLSQQGLPVGYVRVSQAEGLSQGQIDFLAVQPQYQGQGLGRRLLQAGLHWIFNLRGLAEAHLVVSSDNPAALQLYHSVGFELLRTGLPLNWHRSGQSG